jgi:integrase
MAHIEKRITESGKATYRAKVQVKGSPRRTATFEKLGDARAWATAIETDMRLGKYGHDMLARKYTARDMIERYLKSVLTTKTDNESTIAGQRRQLEWWAARLGDTLLINLTPFLINDCKDELLSGGRAQRSPATVNRYLSVLNHVINTAIKEWGWLGSNPISKISKLPEPRGRARYLTDAELVALLEACRAQTRKPLYLIVLFALCTGARKGEILGLRRKDVDVVRRVAVAYDTKNGDNRQLYLCEYLCQQLADHMVKRSHSRLLFGTRQGAPLSIEKEWRRALELARVEDFRFHDLRHTNASYLAMNGASPSDIAEALGHKSYDMVKRYSHLSTTHVGNVVRGMNEKMFGQLTQGVSA